MSKSDDETDMTKFFNLIDEVKKIDNNAALYLLNMVVNDHKLSVNVGLLNSDDLGEAFLWDKTEQGKSFWKNIYIKLEENNEKI